MTSRSSESGAVPSTVMENADSSTSISADMSLKLPDLGITCAATQNFGRRATSLAYTGNQVRCSIKGTRCGVAMHGILHSDDAMPTHTTSIAEHIPDMQGAVWRFEGWEGAHIVGVVEGVGGAVIHAGQHRDVAERADGHRRVPDAQRDRLCELGVVHQLHAAQEDRQLRSSVAIRKGR